MTSDPPQAALTISSMERPRLARKPATWLQVGSGRAQLSLVEHALCPLDLAASLQNHLVHATTYGYRDRKGRLVVANVRVSWSALRGCARLLPHRGYAEPQGQTGSVYRPARDGRSCASTGRSRTAAGPVREAGCWKVPSRSHSRSIFRGKGGQTSSQRVQVDRIRVETAGPVVAGAE